VPAALCKPKADRGTRSLSNATRAMQLRFCENKRNVIRRAAWRPREPGSGKSQTPNPTLQTNRQNPKISAGERSRLNIDVWDFLGIWDLDLRRYCWVNLRKILFAEY